MKIPLQANKLRMIDAKFNFGAGEQTNNCDDFYQSSISSSNKSFVSDLVWIQRGVAKQIPDRIEIEKDDFRKILQDAQEETTTSDDDEDQGNGLRGSASRLQMEFETSENVNDKYELGNYDESKKIRGPSMKGLAYYASPMDDPYITRNTDTDDELEQDDFQIKPTDNLVAVAKVVKDDPILEVYVWNEENNDWYVHHDYFLDSLPLALCAFNYDPGADTGKGNLIALGCMDSAISIWDLDIVNAVKPVMKLGQVRPGTRRGGKPRSINNRGETKGHSDAVLCLDWSEQVEHVLASGGADETVILWDLEKAKMADRIKPFSGMVQSIKWHPVETALLLSGTRAGVISCHDCRAEANPVFSWTTFSDGAEVEKVLWDKFNPSFAFGALDNGKFVYLDTRKPGRCVFEEDAHSEGCNSIAQSPSGNDIVVTSGVNELKVWKIESAKPSLLRTKSVRMGRLNVAHFCPDSTTGTILAVGGESEDSIRIIDLAKSVDNIRIKSEE